MIEAVRNSFRRRFPLTNFRRNPDYSGIGIYLKRIFFLILEAKKTNKAKSGQKPHLKKKNIPVYSKLFTLAFIFTSK